jgi:transposase
VYPPRVVNVTVLSESVLGAQKESIVIAGYNTSRSITANMLVKFISISAVHTRQIRIEFLPPFSSDLIPIEEACSKAKGFLYL